MKVLVTGGAGFIGSHLVDRLLARGDHVVVVDDFNDFYDPEIKRANVGPHLEDPAFRLFELDIRDGAAVAGVMGTARPDAVVHLAARAGVRPSIADPILYEETNCLGTLNILEAVRGLGLRNFVFASSSSVYGVNSKVPFSEEDPITCPISPYASTKRAGELHCHAYSHLYGLPVTCLRFFTVYGERGRPDMAVAKFTARVWEGRPIEVYGDGTARRDFTYISDIVTGVVAALDRPARYEIINIGGSRTVEVRRLIEVIEDCLGRKARIDFQDPAPGDVPITYADASKAEDLLGFRAEVGIEEGVRRYVDWFLERMAGRPEVGRAGGGEGAG